MPTVMHQPQPTAAKQLKKRLLHVILEEDVRAVPLPPLPVDQNLCPLLRSTTSSGCREEEEVKSLNKAVQERMAIASP